MEVREFINSILYRIFIIFIYFFNPIAVIYFNNKRTRLSKLEGFIYIPLSSLIFLIILILSFSELSFLAKDLGINNIDFFDYYPVFAIFSLPISYYIYFTPDRSL